MAPFVRAGVTTGRLNDLFHAYTVDAHTLKVILNMRLFRHQDQAEKFPIANRIVRKLPKVALLYVAGLYHDIGKGRGERAGEAE